MNQGSMKRHSDEESWHSLYPGCCSPQLEIAIQPLHLAFESLEVTCRIPVRLHCHCYLAQAARTPGTYANQSIFTRLRKKLRELLLKLGNTGQFDHAGEARIFINHDTIVEDTFLYGS